MTDFLHDKTYIFTASFHLVEYKKDVIQDRKNLLGKFIRYYNVAYQNELYEKGKAEFEFGFVNFPYYESVQEE
jgi:hypothetical protein